MWKLFRAGLGGILILFVTQVAVAETLYLTAGKMIDTLGGRILDNPVVEIEDDRIASVVSGGVVPNGATVIDLGEATILPGLADMHTHLTYYATDAGYNALAFGLADQAIRGVVNAKITLEAGFTVARNVGADQFADVALREAINAGKVPGPRLQVSGPALGVTGGHCDNNMLPPEADVVALGVADSPWGVRQRVRENRKYRVDLIKFCATGGVLSKGTSVGAQQYTFEEMQAIVDEAHMRGMKVAAHAHGTQGIKTAIRAGVDSIEHSSLIDDEGIALAIENGTFLAMDIYNTEFIQSMGAEVGISEESLAKDREVATAQRANFSKAHKAGAKVVFATDSAVYPHGDNANQFSRMVDLGMAPMDAIQAATTVAAELLGWQGQTGAIADGYYADIIAVKGNPLDDISTLENVIFVMKGGADWLLRFDVDRFESADVQATLCELSAVTIATAITAGAAITSEVFVCGGGTHNAEFMSRLSHRLPGTPVTSTAAAGLDPEWVEAVAFAWLAMRTINGQTGNLPSVTGASHKVVLGDIHSPRP